jgi:predicted amidophosphoribosyltransferase
MRWCPHVHALHQQRPSVGVCANCANPHQRVLCRRCGGHMSHHTDRRVGYHLTCLQKRAPPA